MGMQFCASFPKKGKLMKTKDYTKKNLKLTLKCSKSHKKAVKVENAVKVIKTSLIQYFQLPSISNVIKST